MKGLFSSMSLEGLLIFMNSDDHTGVDIIRERALDKNKKKNDHLPLLHLQNQGGVINVNRIK